MHPGVAMNVDRDRILTDLRAIGVQRGTTLVVHSSLRSIAPDAAVVGGAATVVDSLIEAIGNGTLAMPAATPRCAEPTAEPFDRATTPTTMGAIAEAFRTWPGTLRSDHPLESVCARGPHAADITREHPLAFSEGPGSPFAKLHDLDARILLLGVGFNRCTALHFAESLSAKRRTMMVRFPRVVDDRREMIEVPNVADDLDTHFPIIGARYGDRAARGTIGKAQSSLVAMSDLVAFARAYFDHVLGQPSSRSRA
jgi:aminoglycoside 3-N-acetyltransferase